MSDTTINVIMLIGTLGFFALSIWVSKIYARSYIKRNFPSLVLDSKKNI